MKKNIKKTHKIKYWCIIMLLIFIACNNEKKHEPDTSENIIQSIIQKHNQSALKKQHFISGYYYECAQINNKCVSFAEAIGVLVYHGEDCIIPTSSYTFLPSNIRKRPSETLWLEYLETMYKKSGGEVVSQSNFPPEYNTLFNAFRRFEINGPLSDKMKRYYSFNILKEDEKMLSIEFTPAENSLTNNYEGIIFSNKDNKNIDSIKISRASYYSNQHMDFIDGWLQIHYANNKTTSWPSMVSGGYNLQGTILKTHFSTLNNTPSVSDFSEDDFFLMLEYSDNPILVYCDKEWIKHNTKLNKSQQNNKCNCNIDFKPEYEYMQPFYTAVFSDGEEAPEMTKDEAAQMITRINKLQKQLK